MIRNTGRFEPGEDDLPEGWDPEKEADPKWEGIRELMKAADDPAMPPASTFDAIRIQSRRSALEEGLLNLPDPPRQPAEEMRFRDWLRLLVVGGGVAAQTTRLGIVGTAAFVLGMQVIATTPEEGILLADADSADTIALAEAVGTDQPSEQRFTSTSVPRSIHEVSSGARGWYYNNPTIPRGTPTGTGAVTVSAAASPGGDFGLATQALNQVQVLKFQSLISQDERGLAELRRLERTLTLLLSQAEQQNQPEAEAVRHYRLAEQYLAARRYLEAQETLERVIRVYPGSPHAFLAQFQIGAIAFERTGEYGLALEAFQRCLSDYPSQMIPGQHRRYLQDRVRILEETSGEDWHSLQAWQNAERTGDAATAARFLVGIVQDSGSELLAAEAAIRIKDLTIADALRGDIDERAMLAALQSRANTLQPSAEAARIQFAAGEIAARRIGDAAIAIEEYQKTLRMKPDPQIRAATEARIAALEHRAAMQQ